MAAIKVRNLNLFCDFNESFLGKKREIKLFLKLKEKRRKTSMDIHFINRCLRNKVTPSFVRKIVKYDKNSKQQLAAEKKVLELEKHKHYTTLSNLDLKLYKLHLELVNLLGLPCWSNLESNFFNHLNFVIKQKTATQKKKFRNLVCKQKMSTTPAFSKNFENNVVNLSSENFSKEEMNVLQQGLKTSIDFSNNIEDFVADTEIAITGLKTEDQQIIRHKCKGIIDQIKINSHQFSHHRKVLNSLKNKNVRYTKADKGNKIVILNNEDYVNRIENLLNSGDYTELKTDPLAKSVRMVEKTLNSISTIMSKKDKALIKVPNPILPRIYGLPKIHKPGEKMRPISNNIDAPTHLIAKWLVKKFQSFPSFDNRSLNNSLEFIEKVKNVKIFPDDRLVSFDVVNLFPSIPIEKACCSLRIWLDSLQLVEAEIEEYMELTRLCISQPYFSFNGKFYKQNSGLAMGNPLSPFIANLYMGAFETHINAAFPLIFKAWHRFVDDIFVILNKKQIEDALKLLNLQDSAIKFTLEQEKDNCLPFLDLKLLRNDTKIDFAIYRKDTHTDSYIKANGYNPTAHKHSVFNSLTHRLVNVPLNEENYQLEYKHIKNTAISNGFSTNLINSLIKKFKQQKRIKDATTLQKQQREKQLFRKFTYHPWAHNKFQKVFKSFNITLAPKNNFNIKNLLKVNKTDEVPCQKKSGIYQINCLDCDKVYIGKTKRRIDIRTTEHIRNIKNGEIEKSAIASHCWSEKHMINKDVKLLKHLNKATELTVWEKIFIHRYKNKIMNFEIPGEQDLVYKFIHPPIDGNITVPLPPCQLESS